MKILLFFMTLHSFAQSTNTEIQAYSLKINKSLPEVYDHVTKLISTSVENNNFYYHFQLKATLKEFTEARPKANAQVLKTVCSQSRERVILQKFKANLIYRYENDKGISLGEFMIRPSHCQK